MLPEDNNDQPPVSPAQQTGPKKKQNHQAKRTANHRIQAGTLFMAQLQEQIAKRLEVNLAYEFQERLQTKELGSTTVVPVPTTTRGIGMTIAYSASYFFNRFPQAIQRANFNLHSLYRFSLAQFKKQLFQSDRTRARADIYDRDVTYPTPIFSDFFHSVNVKQNLGLVASSINSVGTIEIGQTIYKCYVPDMPRGSLSHPVPGTSRGKRRAAVASRIIPDPYLVTLDNLREVVLALADDETPLIERQRFMMLDPIPGSNWDRDNALLLNPDIIMPDAYNDANFRADQHAVNDLIANIKARDKAYIGEVPMQGEGSPSSLTNTTQMMTTAGEINEFATDMFLDLNLPGPELMARTPLPIEPMFRQLGVIHLMSEKPLAPIVPLDESWSLRSPYVSVFQAVYRWDTLVDRVLNHMPL